MPAVCFYLKKADGKPAQSLIYLQFKYNGRKLVYSFGQKVKPGNWDKKKQRVKSNVETTAGGQHSLNDLLDNLKKVCEKAYNDELSKGFPSPSLLKQRLDGFMNQNEEKNDGITLYALFDRFISGEIGEKKSKSTLQNYDTTKGHLKEYQAVKKEKVDFDTVTLDFRYKFVAYLQSRNKYQTQIKSVRLEFKTKQVINLSNNTIAKDINIIKTVMGEAVDLGYTANTQFRHKKFGMSEKDVDSVYLSTDEIINLYNFDFTGNKRLEAVRDLFVVGCFTGLRYSDYSNIRPENIIKDNGDFFIKMITQKTGELVIIPCNPIVLQIFDKYQNNNNQLPRSISGQKFNDYLKEACKLAGFIEKARLISDPGMELWECVSSHTARRSGATNLYLEGFPTIDLMKITGHRTEKAFLKYIKVSKLDSAKRLSEHIKRNWSTKIPKILRVAS